MLSIFLRQILKQQTKFKGEMGSCQNESLSCRINFVLFFNKSLTNDSDLKENFENSRRV